MPWTWTLRFIGIVRTMIIFWHLICLRVLWWDVSVFWGQNLVILAYGSCTWSYGLLFYRSWDDFDYLYEDDIVLTQRWSTLWIGYYSGRQTSAIQLYLADFIDNVEQFILFYIEVGNVRYYLYVEDWFEERNLCSDYALYPEEGCTDSMILNSSSEIEFCRFLGAGIVSANLEMKSLRFVNWKLGIEFTSWGIGSNDWCQKFISWTEAAVSHNLT